MNILPLKQGGSSNSVIINVCFFWKKNKHTNIDAREKHMYIYIYIYIEQHTKKELHHLHSQMQLHRIVHEE